MAVIEDNQTVSSNVSGFKKRIDDSAATMMLDNLQTFMYKKPIQSCVRESTSNALDAVKEKRMAMSILRGEAKVSDYYVEKDAVEGQADIYRDSKFDPSYYDLKWLDHRDLVTLEYFNNEQNKRDTFTIKDTGVGLGGKRLEGFFNLGFSSKRLNSKELGGFGLGAKSPLATGVESYRLLTRYNGQEFCFDIYSHKVDCVYSKWNEDGTTNKYYEFQPVEIGREPDTTDENGKLVPGVPIMHTFKAYYKDTLEKNSTSIIVEVKKHNKNQYFDAVKSQLMYIKENITFHESYFNGGRQEIKFKANILFEDDHVIVSDYNFYHRPHFVIKNIGYGIVDWGECELTPRRGNIGIKVQMENVDVLPSREDVVYSPKTRAATVEECNWVTKLVEEKISATLKQDKIVDWIRACNRVMYHNSGSNDYLTILSEFAERSSIKPRFKETDIYFQSDLSAFLTPLIGMEHVYLNSEWDRAKQKSVGKTKRNPATSMSDFNKDVYFQFGPGNARTTQYLLHKHKSGFCTLRASSKYHYLDALLNKLSRKETTILEAKDAAIKAIKENENDATKTQAILDNWNKALEVVTHLLADPTVKVYDESLVPADFVAKAEDADIDFEAVTEAQRKETQKERERLRRENQQFIANRLANKAATSTTCTGGLQRDEIYASVLDSDTCTIVYGSDDDTNTMLNLVAMCRSTAQGQKDRNIRKFHYWDDNVKMLRVAKSNMRYVKGGVHINEWLMPVDENGVLTTDKLIADALTARAIDELLDDTTTFLTNFGEFDYELSEKYNKLCKFVRETASASLLKANDSAVCDKITLAAKAQVQMLNNIPTSDEERDKILGKELVDKGVTKVAIVDEDMYKTAKWIKSFADVFSCLLGYIGPLKDRKQPVLTPALAAEIKSFIAIKRDQLEGDYPNLVS